LRRFDTAFLLPAVLLGLAALLFDLLRFGCAAFGVLLTLAVTVPSAEPTARAIPVSTSSSPPLACSPDLLIFVLFRIFRIVRSLMEWDSKPLRHKMIGMQRGTELALAAALILLEWEPAAAHEPLQVSVMAGVHHQREPCGLWKT
jgi:hypothetical protein